MGTSQKFEDQLVKLLNARALQRYTLYHDNICMSACYTISKIDTAIVMFYKLQYTSIHLNHNKFVFYNILYN